MDNNQTLSYWKKKAGNPTPTSVKVNPINDFTHMDADFILQYADADTEILDLASGTGLIINKLYQQVKFIEAVELFEEFSAFIQKSDNIHIVNQNIKNYRPDKQYDLITMFGIVQYFNEDEVCELYKHYYEYLRPGGTLIIKTQFGVHEDVQVSGYSPELQMDYFSHYRSLDKEISLLKKNGYKDMHTFDIYPPECNRWENTHFYAIVTKK